MRRNRVQKCAGCGHDTDHRVLEKNENTGDAKSLRCLECSTISSPGKKEKKPKVKKEKI